MRSNLKAKTRREERTLLMAFGTGLAAAVIAEIVFLALLALLTSSGTIAESAMPVFAAICAMLSSFAGSFIGALGAPKLSLPIALGVGAAVFAVNFAIGMLLPAGEGLTVSMPAAFIGGAVLAGILAAVKKGGK